MRRGFSLLAAIIFIIIIGILFALIISMLTITTQRTMDHYLHNQEELLARSAVEYAILAAGGHDYTANCLNNVSINYANTYDIAISIHYIGNDLPANCNILDASLTDARDNGTAVVDVRVSIDPNALPNQNPVTFARRFIQKL